VKLEEITPRVLALTEKRARVQVNEFMDRVAVALYTSNVSYEEIERAERYLGAIQSLLEAPRG
jgi:hypothetical protein